MAKTVVGSFDSYSEAQSVVEDLVNIGIDRDEISIVANDTSGRDSTNRTDSAAGTASGAGKGAVVGGAIGGAAGLAACGSNRRRSGSRSSRVSEVVAQPS